MCLIYIQGSRGPDRIYGSWILRLSPLISLVRISIRARRTTLCDELCQWLATGRWFSPGLPVSSTNKNDRHDITEILLKVTINLTPSNKQTNKQIYIHTFCLLILILFYYCLLPRALHLNRQHYRKTVPEGEDNNIYITSLSCDKRKKQLGKSVGVYIAKHFSFSF
jgi:hypothetical protein